MSNLERDPAEVTECSNAEPLADIQVLEPREVPLGGPRAMTVRRTLPSKQRSLIGAWCFLDHYGPETVAATGGMRVPPHPHTGLQTVSWLFEGEIEHRDSVGSHAIVRPGELNLMTAGRGISHSEVSTPETTLLHGAQLWVALPEAERHRLPSFESHVSQKVEVGDARIQVFMGRLAGVEAEALMLTELVAAQIDLPAGGTVELDVTASHEHGVLVDSGRVSILNRVVEQHELAYLAPGCPTLTLSAGDEPVRLLLIGGEPLGEKILMWWNFVGRTHEEVVSYRAAWQAEALGEPGTATPAGLEDLFVPTLPGTEHFYEGGPLPAPALPTVRLKPRP
ncbi:pirin family protein [Subtercola endophyticus]|uniref:pirin family protein n=1 Tax=Subtercola endophyticus TaxID=2895559 RepID=UPI001E548733|nr:pirin family protein [Subtercola endophyticus]UFS59084.1 pirin family protein [Subtercola endophyticus]